LEKKMTAFVIPNAIQLTTRTAKYTFASFLARDTVYDVIYNIWRLARPDEDEGRRRAMEDAQLPMRQDSAAVEKMGVPIPGVVPVRAIQKMTQCTCGREGKHYNETALESVLPGTPERIYNLMFASGFIKDFMRVEQRLDGAFLYFVVLHII